LRFSTVNVSGGRANGWGERSKEGVFEMRRASVPVRKREIVKLDEHSSSSVDGGVRIGTTISGKYDGSRMTSICIKEVNGRGERDGRGDVYDRI
jgi:hypothetical protein